MRARAQVGVPLLLTKEDLKRVAPLWMHYTRQVRLDPTVRRTTKPAASDMQQHAHHH